jgi:hypothetical protein
MPCFDSFNRYALRGCSSIQVPLQQGIEEVKGKLLRVKGYNASVRTIAGSFAPSFASSELAEESRRLLRTIASPMRSIAHVCKAHSRSYRRSADHYGKIPYITRPLLTTYRDVLQHQLAEIKSPTEGKELDN